MLLQTTDDEISTAKSPQRYRYLGKVGTGGMADVYLGIQRGERDFTRLVAIKRLHRTAVTDNAVDPTQLFVAEARVVATLNHPHIVKVYDLIPHKGDILIVMEFVDGETLQTIMADTVRAGLQIPLPIVCRWVADAAEALHYAHNAVSLEGESLRLVHRDIDMRNIMVDSNGYVKIIDFGVAQTISRFNGKTGAMGFMGKISYAAPESFSAPESIDHRADLYALGLVFHALTTQRKPYPAKSAASTGELVQKVINEPLLRPSSLNPHLPSQLDLLIGQATHKDPAMRFQNGEAFAQAVEAFAKEHEGLATPQEVKRWYQTHFKERNHLRESFVQQAMERAKAFVQSETFSETAPERDSMTPSLALASPMFLASFDSEEVADENATAVYLYPKAPFHPIRHARYATVAGIVLAAAILTFVFGWVWNSGVFDAAQPSVATEKSHPESVGSPLSDSVPKTVENHPNSPEPALLPDSEIGTGASGSQPLEMRPSKTILSEAIVTTRELPKAPTQRRFTKPRYRKSTGTDMDIDTYSEPETLSTAPAPPADRGARILTNYEKRDLGLAVTKKGDRPSSDKRKNQLRLLESYDQ